MTRAGETSPSAAPPTDAFAGALSAFNEAREAFIQKRDALELAQTEQAAAINALPEADRADMAQLEGIADRLGINALGSDLLDQMMVGEAALKRLVQTPAPTVRALHDKIHAVAHAPWGSGADWPEDDRKALWGSLLTDAAALAGEAHHA